MPEASTPKKSEYTKENCRITGLTDDELATLGLTREKFELLSTEALEFLVEKTRQKHHNNQSDNSTENRSESNPTEAEKKFELVIKKKFETEMENRKGSLSCENYDYTLFELTRNDFNSLPIDALQKRVKSTYRTLALKYHSDKYHSDKYHSDRNNANFQELEAAKDRLLVKILEKNTPQERKNYQEKWESLHQLQVTTKDKQKRYEELNKFKSKLEADTNKKLSQKQYIYSVQSKSFPITADRLLFNLYRMELITIEEIKELAKDQELFDLLLNNLDLLKLDYYKPQYTGMPNLLERQRPYDLIMSFKEQQQNTLDRAFGLKGFPRNRVDKFSSDLGRQFQLYLWRSVYLPLKQAQANIDFEAKKNNNNKKRKKGEPLTTPHNDWMKYKDLFLDTTQDQLFTELQWEILTTFQHQQYNLLQNMQAMTFIAKICNPNDPAGKCLQIITDPIRQVKEQLEAELNNKTLAKHKKQTIQNKIQHLLVGIDLIKGQFKAQIKETADNAVAGSTGTVNTDYQNAIQDFIPNLIEKTYPEVEELANAKTINGKRNRVAPVFKAVLAVMTCVLFAGLPIVVTGALKVTRVSSKPYRTFMGALTFKSSTTTNMQLVKDRYKKNLKSQKTEVEKSLNTAVSTPVPKR